jgi:hypothetical protein
MQMGVLGRALYFCSRAICSIPSVDLISHGVVGDRMKPRGLHSELMALPIIN